MATQNARRDKRLKIAEIAIENTLNQPDLITTFQKYSYTKQKIEAGNALRKTAQEAHHKQQREYSEQTASTDKFEHAWDAAHKIYMHQVKVARLAFKRDEASLNLLGLQGIRKESFSGWCDQVDQFYSSLAAPRPRGAAGRVRGNGR